MVFVMSWDGVNPVQILYRSVEHCTISWPNWELGHEIFPNHDKHQQLLLQFIVLLMMDAKGVRNMQSILVVVNKHNTARVASCWFIIYYRIVMDGNLNIKKKHSHLIVLLSTVFPALGEIIFFKLCTKMEALQKYCLTFNLASIIHEQLTHFSLRKVSFILVHLHCKLTNPLRGIRLQSPDACIIHTGALKWSLLSSRFKKRN